MVYSYMVNSTEHLFYIVNSFPDYDSLWEFMVLLFLSELQCEVYSCRAPASFFRVALIHYVVAWPYCSFLGWLHLSRDLWKPRWSMDMRIHRPCVPGHGGRWAVFVFIPTWLWHLTLHGSFCSDPSSLLLLLLWPGPGGQAENCPHPQWLPCLACLFPWESPLSGLPSFGSSYTASWKGLQDEYLKRQITAVTQLGYHLLKTIFPSPCSASCHLPDLS